MCGSHVMIRTATGVEMRYIQVMGTLITVLAITGAMISFIKPYRRWRLCSVGLILADLFLLASTVWPFDSIWPMARQRVSTSIDGYRIDFVQVPGTDFYQNTVEFIQPDGPSLLRMSTPGSVGSWGSSATEPFCVSLALMTAQWVTSISIRRNSTVHNAPHRHASSRMQSSNKSSCEP